MDALTPLRDRCVMAGVDDRPMWRASGVAAVMLMACGSLSGCYLGPDPIQYAALAVVDDRPTAVVATCGKETAFPVTVYRHDNSDEFRHWSVNVTPSRPARAVEVELLGKPRPGWEITTQEASSPGGMALVPLTSFEAGYRYVLDSSKGGPEGSSAPAAEFTMDDVAALGADQVLAPIDHDHSKVVSRDSFVKERCG